MTTLIFDWLRLIAVCDWLVLVPTTTFHWYLQAVTRSHWLLPPNLLPDWSPLLLVLFDWLPCAPSSSGVALAMAPRPRTPHRCLCTMVANPQTKSVTTSPHLPSSSLSLGPHPASPRPERTGMSERDAMSVQQVTAIAR